MLFSAFLDCLRVIISSISHLGGALCQFKRLTLEIIIEVKNVSQNFKPDPITLKILMGKVEHLYTEAYKPLFVEPHVRFIFSPAEEFEFFLKTSFLLPTKQVSVNIYPKWAVGDQPCQMVNSFYNSAIEIAYFAKSMIEVSNHNNLLLPAQINVSSSSQTFAADEGK